MSGKILVVELLAERYPNSSLKFLFSVVFWIRLIFSALIFPWNFLKSFILIACTILQKLHILESPGFGGSGQKIVRYGLEKCYFRGLSDSSKQLCRIIISDVSRFLYTYRGLYELLFCENFMLNHHVVPKLQTRKCWKWQKMNSFRVYLEIYWSDLYDFLKWVR